jgi:hypothetical protein
VVFLAGMRRVVFLAGMRESSIFGEDGEISHFIFPRSCKLPTFYKYFTGYNSEERRTTG